MIKIKNRKDGDESFLIECGSIENDDVLRIIFSDKNGFVNYKGNYVEKNTEFQIDTNIVSVTNEMNPNSTTLVTYIIELENGEEILYHSPKVHLGLSAVGMYRLYLHNIVSIRSTICYNGYRVMRCDTEGQSSLMKERRIDSSSIDGFNNIKEYIDIETYDISNIFNTLTNIEKEITFHKESMMLKFDDIFQNSLAEMNRAGIDYNSIQLLSNLYEDEFGGAFENSGLKVGDIVLYSPDGFGIDICNPYQEGNYYEVGIVKLLERKKVGISFTKHKETSYASYMDVQKINVGMIDLDKVSNVKFAKEIISMVNTDEISNIK